MAIQQIDEQGNLTWKCPHVPAGANKPCGAQYDHHISHEHIQWCMGSKPEHHTVSLPPCSCGAQTFLKVSFTEQELMAPNMWLEWNSERAANLLHFQEILPELEKGSADEAMVLRQIELLQKIKQAGGIHTNTHATALRHQELARQLVASGKIPGGQ